MTMTATDVPAGFKPHFRKSAVTDPWEPLYSRREDRKVVIGLHVRKAHCNSRGFIHGGVLAALADNSMGLSAGEALRSEGRANIRGLVTVNLTTDYISGAPLGAWLEVDTHFVKTGGSICFTDCFILADSEPVARSSASFKILK